MFFNFNTFTKIIIDTIAWFKFYVRSRTRFDYISFITRGDIIFPLLLVDKIFKELLLVSSVFFNTLPLLLDLLLI